MIYDYKKRELLNPGYDLNPEVIESTCYLYHTTGDAYYQSLAVKYWQDIKKYCRTDIAYTSIKDVVTKEKRDYMPTFFLAETLKYFYLIFVPKEKINFDDYIFTTEAHSFKRDLFDPAKIKERLGF